ncbi:MAG TPA: GNAT family N-acetyltransferase [Thermoanaerobaculia bacterium]|nr:GNAT family N-acetyltransferase [Thermoanaerobaculia bacterium]
MPDVMVRNATLDDAAALAMLAGELGYPSTETEMRARLARVSASAGDAVLVATVESETAGWMHLAEVLSIETGSYVEIRGLVVHAPLRSHGIGARLVAAAEEWARARGLARMRVRSNVVRERTHTFYERLGYAVTKTQKTFDKSL